MNPLSKNADKCWTDVTDVHKYKMQASTVIGRSTSEGSMQTKIKNQKIRLANLYCLCRMHAICGSQIFKIIFFVAVHTNVVLFLKKTDLI